jgi:putative methyltransferase (TIGR04325 family)
LETKELVNNRSAALAANIGTNVNKNAKIRFFVKRVLAQLPWGIRKVVAFLGTYGLVNLLTSKRNFDGIYPSFADAPQIDRPNNQYLIDGAALHLRAQKFDDATGLPILRNSHSLLPLTVSVLSRLDPIRILDIGGAGGIDFANLLSAVPRLSQVQYRVIDLPQVCEFGRRRWENDQRISFDHAMPSEREKFDLIYSSWAIQYFPEPLQFLEKLTVYEAQAILLINVPFTAKDAFVRVQLNKLIPSWVLSLPAIERQMGICGYVLSFHAARDVGHNVDNYPPEYRVSNLTDLLFLKT